MGSSDLFPEKFAMYFGTMSPLATKIYADIEGIEDYIKSHGPPSITYSEKCTIVDKFLIYDHLPKNDANGKLNKRLSEFQKCQLNKSETSLNCMLDNNEVILISEAELLQPVFYNDATLDHDHESVLLTSVAPKKPEKYVYDENNYWTDEHSVPYSSCTQTQAKACKLQSFLDSLPPPPQPHKQHDHPLKYRAPPIPSTVPSVVRGEVDDDEDYIIRPAKNNSDQEYADRYSKIDKLNSEKSANKYSVAVPVFGGMFGDAPQKKNSSAKPAADLSGNEQDLPNQVQNKDLIAELQAKLKKGKPHSDVPNSEIGDTSSARSSMKLHKPKAPPPPPPGNLKPPGGAVKVKETKKSKDDKEESPKMAGREISDEFVVDVSSPCKTVTTKTGLDFLDNW